MITEPAANLAPLDLYEARAVEAAEMFDAAQRKLEATPDHVKAQRIARAAGALATLTATQSNEALARHDVEVNAARLATWPRDRRALRLLAVTWPLWAPGVVIGAVLLGLLMLTILLLGLVAFLLICTIGKSSHLAALAMRSAERAAITVGKVQLDMLRGAFRPPRRGTRADLAERLANCEAASERHETALLALVAAERGMPFTEVYPLAGLDEKTANRIELGVYAELHAWRSR